MTIKVLIFDIDLTICNNSQRKRLALERALSCKISNQDWTQIKSEYYLDKILSKLKIQYNELILQKFLSHFLYDEDLFQYDKPFQFAVPVINELKNKYQIYYLTARTLCKTAHNFITKYSFYDGTIYCCDDTNKKNSYFQKIIDHSISKPYEIISISDLPDDGITAKKLGIISVGTYEGCPSNKNHLEKVCDYTISNINELPNLLTTIY